jgi:hypothetical protein
MEYILHGLCERIWVDEELNPVNFSPRVWSSQLFLFRSFLERLLEDAEVSLGRTRVIGVMVLLINLLGSDFRACFLGCASSWFACFHHKRPHIGPKAYTTRDSIETDAYFLAHLGPIHTSRFSVVTFANRKLSLEFLSKLHGIITRSLKQNMCE